jgi:transcription initiation factor IIE alpha subunit
MTHKLDLVAIKKNDVYYVRDRDKYPSTFDDAVETN